MTELATCIVRHWVHSHEEDTQDTKVYRPANYNFPLSRGRSGLEFQAGGSFIYHGIAAGDGPTELSGRWALADQDHIMIDISGQMISPRFLMVKSCSITRLEIKKPIGM